MLQNFAWKYHKGPHEIVSRSWTHVVYTLQRDKDFISTLQVEDPSQKTAPQIPLV